MPRDDAPIVAFKSARAFEAWMARHHDTHDAIWLRMYKKASGVPTVSYAEALDVALCYGWIDGQVNKYDDVSYIQRFTPRRARSIWSKINVGHVARLTREGRMQPAGIAAVDAAKRDGRWAKAYDSPKDMQVPDDFLRELRKNKKAYAFFESLNRQNKFAIAFRLHSAKKPETRAKRMQDFLARLTAGRKIIE